MPHPRMRRGTRQRAVAWIHLFWQHALPAIVAIGRKRYIYLLSLRLVIAVRYYTYPVLDNCAEHLSFIVRALGRTIGFCSDCPKNLARRRTGFPFENDTMENAYAMKSGSRYGPEVHHSRTSSDGMQNVEKSIDRDEQEMARLGKRQELRVWLHHLIRGIADT